ncbi:MAG: YeeE/YedE family protein [Actinomycetota bacterium]|nr:YeeE/YedE family protein [Actinomycetota bacterium]
MNLIGLAFGTAFGFLIALGGLNDYEVIHNMLLLEDFQPYLIMGSAVAVAAPVLWVLERRHWTTPYGGELELARSRPQRHHIVGAAIFGTGWAVAGTCPAPALAMGASGAWLGLVVVGGLFAGLFARDSVEQRPADATHADLDMGRVATAT